MIDLQIHSYYSDGSSSPRELVLEAKRLPLTAIALTDHDTVDGIPEFLEAGSEFKLNTIAGVEISTDADIPPNGSLHLLGLFIDHHQPELKAQLDFLRQHRHQRAEKILEKLKEFGIEISREELLQEAGFGSIGRPHIASLLKKKKVVSSLQAAFDQYLAKGKPAFVEKVKLPEEHAIQLIKRAGGLAILAHPHLMNYPTFLELEKKVVSLKEMGLDGLEAYYSGMSKSFTSKLLELGKKLDLLISGGSDYHGKNKSGIWMGTGSGNLHIPDSVYYHLKERWEKNKGRSGT